MSVPNPFLPAGSLPTLQERQRSQLRTGVFAVLTAHFLLLTGLLIQGCKTQNQEPVPLYSDIPGVTSPKAAPAPAPVQPAPPTTTPAPTPAVSAAPPAPAPPAAVATTYKIKRGDTLSGIAKKFHTSVAELKKLNHLKSDRIVAGKSLQIPATAGQ